MKRFAMSEVAFSLIFLITFPIVFPVLAMASISVEGFAQDVDGNGYKDLIFYARDALNKPVADVEVNVTVEGTEIPVFEGRTNASGVLVFWDIPPLNYSWTASTGQSGIFINEVPPHEFDIPEELALFSWLLWLKWCENSTEKGRSFLKGMAAFLGYDKPLPIPHDDDNFRRVVQYARWLQGLSGYVKINSKQYDKSVFDFATVFTTALADVLIVYGAKSLEYGLPLEQAKSILDTTEAYKTRYFVLHAPSREAFNIFNFRMGMQAGFFAIVAALDLFIISEGNPYHLVEVVLGDDFTFSERLQVVGDLAQLSESILTWTTMLAIKVKLIGTAATGVMIKACEALSAITSIISIGVIVFNLWEKYGTWQNFVAHLNSPEVLYNIALIFTSAASAIIFIGVAFFGLKLAVAMSWIPIIAAATIIATILYVAWQWITEYWAYVDRIREQISYTMDQIIPIRQTLYRYNLTKLETEANYYDRLATAALNFATRATGEFKEDLMWANKYFLELKEAQLELIQAINESRYSLDKFILTHLYYDSADGTKHIRAHLEGINCTNAQYLNPWQPDFFSFKACVYHPSRTNPGTFVFDNHTITYDNLDGVYSETDYSKISRYDPLDIIHPQKGWAWVPPIEHDAQNRTFAVTYTLNASHHPSGTPTGYNFYFDPAGQWYASPWNPWRFDPDEHYRADAKITSDPNTGNISYFYHYKFFFDPGTTGEWWGLGRPDALDEWMQNLTSQLPSLKAKLDSFVSALDKLRAAFSQKRYKVPLEPIEKGLAWLRAKQRADGSWYGSSNTFVGVTSLAVLAFLNAGHDEADPTVKKAIQYILKNVRSDGSIYSNYDSRTYETSLAIIALVATRNESYRGVIENAKNWLVNSQWDESCLWGKVDKDNWYYGGFGYGRNVRPDLSNTQFALLALDAAGLPKDDPLWKKVQVFLHRCQNVNFSITLNIDGAGYTVQPYNHQGGYDGGFIYHPGASLAGGQKSYGSMTGAGIWGLLLSGVKMDDRRVQAALNWVRNHYTWSGNPGMPDPTSGLYYYYLSMAKALTMTGLTAIDGHDWYRELYDKLAALQRPEGYWVNSNSWAMENVAEYTTACAVLSLQTRVTAPPVHRLSYLTFILRSNCLLKVIDPEGRPVGYKYVAGLGENQVPTAVYSGPFMEPQYIVIVNPKAGTYRLELIGISEGPYELTIQGNYGEEITDTFEYTGEIKPAELHGCDVTVTAIVGPIDVYANPPEFEEIIDNIPPTTTLNISEPKYVSPTDNIYVSSATQFTLNAEDNLGGTGVASTYYRVYNASYDTGWMNYFAPFSLPHLMDGQYNLTFYSVDKVGNTERAKQIDVYLDNAAPSLFIGIISSRVYAGGSATFNLTVSDVGSGVRNVSLYIDGELVANWTAAGVYTFVSEPLREGKHSFYAVAFDNLGNTVTSDVYEFEVFPRLPSRLIVVFAVAITIACLVIALLFAAKRGELRRVGRGYVTRPPYPSEAVKACPLCGGVLRYDSRANRWYCEKCRRYY